MSVSVSYKITNSIFSIETMAPGNSYRSWQYCLVLSYMFRDINSITYLLQIINHEKPLSYSTYALIKNLVLWWILNESIKKLMKWMFHLQLKAYAKSRLYWVLISKIDLKITTPLFIKNESLTFNWFGPVLSKIIFPLSFFLPIFKINFEMLCNV